MRELLWSIFAWVVSRRPIASFIIARGRCRTNFLISEQGLAWWVFNPFWHAPNKFFHCPPQKEATRRFNCPSIALVYAGRPDWVEELHDHPCIIREIVLRGWQRSERLESGRTNILVRKGEMQTFRPGQFHRVKQVASEGCWSLMIVGKFECDWGFLVNGRKVSYRDYAQRD